MANDFQVPVYQFAQKFIKDHLITSVLDIGCGWGVKLDEFIRPECKEVVGIDAVLEKIEYCKEKYSFGKWICQDLETSSLELNSKYDFIICADVIEHIFSPDRILSFIMNHLSSEGLVLFSTPERDLHRGSKHRGPPPNPSHIREWNKKELFNYITSRGFEIIAHEIVERGRETKGKSCQMLLCRQAKREAKSKILAE